MRRRTPLVTTLINLGLLAASQVGVTLAAFGAQILLARSLSQAEFGVFTTVLALVSMTAPLAVFGVSELWLQRFGQEAAGAFRWVRPSLRLVWACCAVITVGMLLWAASDLAAPAGSTVRALLSTVVVAQAALALAASAQQLSGAYHAMAVLQVAPHMSRLLIALVVWLFGLTVVAAAAGYAVVAALTVVGCLAVLRPFIRGETPLEGQPRSTTAPTGPPVRIGQVIGAAAPFVLGNVFYLLGIYLGTVVTGVFLSPEAAAVLAVPMSILTAVYLVPRVIYQQYFLAKLHRWAHSDGDAILIAYRFGSLGMVLFGVVTAVVVACGGLIAIPFLFGPEYQASTVIMAVLALAIPFRFGGAAVASLLTSGGLLRRKVAHQGVGALVFLLALAVATPVFGVEGAAVATVVGEVVLCCLFWLSVKKNVIAGADLPSWLEVRRRLTRDGNRER